MSKHSIKKISEIQFNLWSFGFLLKEDFLVELSAVKK